MEGNVKRAHDRDILYSFRTRVELALTMAQNACLLLEKDQNHDEMSVQLSLRLTV